VVSLPDAMAVGATGSEDWAQFTGEVTAREARALGIHWAFAPVADVNNNPGNPVINIRSYGEDPGLVSRMIQAFVRGAQSGGLLTTAKHFPGHGDTAVDSHLDLPVVAADKERLQEVELAPFRQAVASGVDAVMLGHVAVPALDPTGTPATLSRVLVTEVLRESMGFDGLVVTDAMEMGGLRKFWAGEAVIGAIQAGADVVLLPPDTSTAIQSLVRAVDEGLISEARIDRSVNRILATKARLGLHKERSVDPQMLGQSVARPIDVEAAMNLVRDSVTVVRNENGLLPLQAEKPMRLLHVVLSSDFNNLAIRGIPESELRSRKIETTTRRVGPGVGQETVDEIVAEASGFTHVLVSAYVRVASSKGTAAMLEEHAEIVSRLEAQDKPVIVLSFGSPYLLTQFPSVPVYICTYGQTASSQRAAIEAIFGEFEVGGKLPVSIPGLFPVGHGIEIPKRPMSLPVRQVGEVGFSAEKMKMVDQLLEDFVQEKAFPGGVLAVGYHGTLAHLKTFGRLTYEVDSPRAVENTIYDLASLTKVVATTTMAMMLVDDGRLNLDKPVQDFLPRFQGPGKEKVTVRQLLTHSSGIDWWAPLYKDLSGKKAYVEHIEQMDLVYEPGTKSLYSDLGLILLGEILERVAGQSLNVFTREQIFEPLGMKDTHFQPSEALLERIAPTEFDEWRGRLLHGEVHDENAHALGGVAPHAGLFSTAGDLARFVQTILNGGVFEHHRLISRPTIEHFVERAGVPDSSRALGWDTKSPEKSSAGSFFSPNSFGHTGFTGTSIWIDPDRELFVILLTNRVHPTRENHLIRKVRPAVADAVVNALESK
jgi:beta-glucosidase-like glycosyl hydrolase/CubicO group peptidase (beta-lactamase class C family)